MFFNSLSGRWEPGLGLGPLPAETTKEQPSKPIIYLAALPCLFPGNVAGYALAEDGTAIISNLFTREGRVKLDLGLEGDANHSRYEEHYPDGYELEWVSAPEVHEGWREAMRRNREEATE